MKLDSSLVTIIIFIIITIIFCILSLFHIYETFSIIADDDRIPEYLKHKSKSYDSEFQMRQIYGDDGAWKANATSCFDCETSAVDQAGGDIKNGFLAKTIKYY